MQKINYYNSIRLKREKLYENVCVFIEKCHILRWVLIVDCKCFCGNFIYDVLMICYELN